MSNIIKIDQIKGLLPTESEALVARYNPKIKEVKIADLRAFIREAITDAHIIMNISSTGPEIAGMTKILADDLKESFTTYSPQEIRVAILMGARGKLGGDAVHVSVKNMHFWIQSYNQLVRQEAIHKEKKHLEELAKQAEEAKKEELRKQFNARIVEHYNAFTESDTIEEDAETLYAARYRHIISIFGQQLTPEQRLQMFEVAQGEQWAQHQREQVDKDLSSRLKDKMHGNNYVEIVKSRAKVIAEARALFIVFAQWKKEGKVLTENLIN